MATTLHLGGLIPCADPCDSWEGGTTDKDMQSCHPGIPRRNENTSYRMLPCANKGDNDNRHKALRPQRASTIFQLHSPGSVPFCHYRATDCVTVARRVLNSLGGCLSCSRSCGGPVRLTTAGDRVLAPSQPDAHNVRDSLPTPETITRHSHDLRWFLSGKGDCRYRYVHAYSSSPPNLNYTTLKGGAN